MKLRIYSTPCIIILAITFIIASCTKEGPAGATGPAGAQGPAGSAGVEGTAGAAGAKGDTGVANVMYSDWIDSTTWNADTVMTGAQIDTVGYFANIDAPKLDLSILSTGDIKVYVNVNSTDDPVIFPIPYNNNLYIDVAFYLNTIQLSSNGDLTGVPFRYILIPGGVKVGRGVKTINWNDYKEVKAYLNLKD